MYQHQRGIVFGVAFLLASGAMAQVDEVPVGAENEAIAPVDVPAMPDQDFIHAVAEQMPEFPGGEQAMLTFLAKNTRYPTDVCVGGVVYVSFVVERDGSLSNVSVLRGVVPVVDQEALRVIKAMPRWKPGMQGGKVVRVKYAMPIRFSLR